MRRRRKNRLAWWGAIGALFVVLAPEFVWRLVGPKWVSTPSRDITQAYWSGGGCEL